MPQQKGLIKKFWSFSCISFISYEIILPLKYSPPVLKTLFPAQLLLQESPLIFLMTLASSKLPLFIGLVILVNREQSTSARPVGKRNWGNDCHCVFRRSEAVPNSRLAHLSSLANQVDVPRSLRSRND